MKKRVTYPREMRERAIAEGKHLVTLDVPGMTVQGPFTKEQVLEVHTLFQKLMKEKT